MELDLLLQLTREALWLVLVVSAPPLLSSMAVGILVSVFQATTQIQEQTLTFVPKLVAAMASLVIAGPWMGEQVVRFTRRVFETVGTAW